MRCSSTRCDSKGIGSAAVPRLTHSCSIALPHIPMPCHPAGPAPAEQHRDNWLPQPKGGRGSGV